MVPTDMVGRLLRFGTVGVLVNLAGYGFFLILLFVALPPVLATGIAYVVAVLMGYLINRRWTFRSKRSHASDLPRYLLAYGVGLFVAVGTMHLLVGLMAPEHAQLIVMVLMPLVIYPSLELVRFGRLEKGNAD